MNLRMLFSEAEQQSMVKAWEAWLERRTGPLVSWLGSQEEGATRMPKLAPEPMAALCRAWLSPEVGFYVHVCRQCGLAKPTHEGWDAETICPTRFWLPWLARTKRNTFRQNTWDRNTAV